MDWDGIKYIFQIPLGWYRKIHNMVFHAYGTNFLMVREGYYGGLEIGIDNQGFSDAVAQLGYGKVKTVDGKEPDDNGNVSFSLTGGKWLKSDANGHIVTTDEDPITVDENEKGYLYNNEGTLEYKDDEYVTIDGDETITGEKTFENTLYISNGTTQYDASILIDNSNNLILSQGGDFVTNVSTLSFNDIVGNGHIDIDPSVPSLELYGHQNGLGGNIDFHTEGSTVDYTSRIIDSANQFAFLTFDRPIFLYSYYQNTSNATGIMIDSANGNYRQLLTNEPARLYSTGADNQIASRGYCRTNFARATHTHGNISSDGKITASRGATTTNYYVAVDNQGNLFREPTSGLSPDMSNYVTTSALNTTLQNYATTTTVSNLTDVVDAINNSYQDASDVSTAISTALQDYVSTSDLNTTLQDYITASDLQTELADYVTDEDLDGFVTSVDGISPVNGAVSFGLAGSKWVKTDSSGHLTTTNDEPITLSSQSSGYLYNNSGTAQYDTLSASKWVKTDSSGHLTTTNESVASFASTPTNNRIVLTDGTSGGLKTLSASGSTTNITVVTSVTWNGTQIVIKSRPLTFTNGILTSTGTESTSNINTVAYTP